MQKTLNTRHLRYTIDSSGRVAEFTDKSTGINYAEEGSLFAYLLPPGEKAAPAAPSSVTWEGDSITARFGERDIYFIIRAEEFPGNIRFTVTGCREGFDYGSFVFAACVLNDKSGSAPFSGSTISLSINCNLLELPGRQTELGAVACRRLGAKTASAALAGAPRGAIRECLKEALKDISPDDIPLNPRGGPFAAEYPENAEDYMIISAPDFDNLDEWLKPAARAGVSQLDLHKGVIFRQGDFEFDREILPGGVHEFRERFSEKIHARGMLAGLHTYSAMVSPMSKFAAPKPDPDLACVRVYTLDGDIDASAGRIPIAEDAGGAPMTQFYSTTSNARCVVIDDELIEFEGVDGNALTGCRRGALNTEPSFHLKGGRVRHLLCLYNEFQSIPGSPLFYKIAEATAEAYNLGDFDTIYFDGLECIGTSLPAQDRELGWHYTALFVREVLRRLSRPPIVEYSILTPLIWTARSRAGAFDSPTSGYRRFIDLHCGLNEQNAARRLLPSQLGWFNLYPPMSHDDSVGEGKGGFPNWHIKYTYSDDIDYLGAKSIAFDSGLSFSFVPSEAVSRFPAYRVRAERIALYSRLRRERRFTDEVRGKLREFGAGFRLVRGDGGYSFERLERILVRPVSLDGRDEPVKVFNPFPGTRPSIRLVAQFGAEGYDSPSARGLLRFDARKPVSAQKTVFDFPGDSLDLSGREALGIRARGNSGREYMTIRLQGTITPFSGVSEHVLPLDFDGWRCFTMCESDNGDFAKVEFREEFPVPLYGRFRQKISYARIGRVSVLFSGGGEGVRLDEVRSVRTVDDPVLTPGIEIGGEEIRFDCSLRPGCYLEYSPGEEYARIYDLYGREEKAAVRGEVGVLPAGESRVSVSGGAEGTFRLKAHLLVAGERILNRPG